MPVHTDYRETIVVDADHPILTWKANRDKLRPSWFAADVQQRYPGGLPKIGSEHSEDAFTWNVFRTLQLHNRIQRLTNIFSSAANVDRLYFWGHDADLQSQKIDPQIQDTLNQMEPWGKDGVKQQTEPDVILRGKYHIVMVECKLGKPGEEIRAWQRNRPSMRAQYATFMKYLGLKLFTDSFDYKHDGIRFYQLFRNYLLGAALALTWNTEFSLLTIVNRLNNNLEGRSHQEEFDSFRRLLVDPSNAFLITWQQVWNALRKERNLERLYESMRKHPLLGLANCAAVD